MNVVLFGATGMVGQGVLRESLADDVVEAVLVIGRSPCGVQHAKVTEVLHDDFYDYTAIADRLAGYDACFFTLGVSSAGMDEATYHRLTYDLTLAAARTLVERNPAMTFCYVSGAGTDSSEKGRFMWARVKGKTENALLGLGFAAAYMFRPGVIRPRDGIKSKALGNRIFYTLSSPLLPIAQAAFPKLVTDTREVGVAMIRVALHGAERTHLENRDIHRLAHSAVAA